MRIPYFFNGKTINIYSPEDELLLEIDVREYAISIENNGESIMGNEEREFEKVGQKIQTYFKEDKTGKIIKYAIYFILGIMVLILVREGIIKIMDKYRASKNLKLSTQKN